jgi:CRISPR/Cas system CSM-associated protein Csm4 (group 5 of RAMP superfamily)
MSHFCYCVLNVYVLRSRIILFWCKFSSFVITFDTHFQHSLHTHFCDTVFLSLSFVPVFFLLARNEWCIVFHKLYTVSSPIVWVDLLVYKSRNVLTSLFFHLSPPEYVLTNTSNTNSKKKKKKKVKKVKKVKKKQAKTNTSRLKTQKTQKFNLKKITQFSEVMLQWHKARAIEKKTQIWQVERVIFRTLVVFFVFL